jgi:hypothetical protein
MVGKACAATAADTTTRLSGLENKSPQRALAYIDVWMLHETDKPAALRDVRSQGQSRKHMPALSFSGLDRRATPISCREPTQTHHRWAAIPSDPPPLQRACRIVKCNVWPHLTMDANVNPLDQRSHARCKSQWRLSTDRVPSNRSTHLCLRSDRHFLPALWDSRSVRGYSQRMQP